MGGTPVALSIGVAEWMRGVDNIKAWTGAADAALDRAKGDGRDRVRA